MSNTKRNFDGSRDVVEAPETIDAYASWISANKDAPNLFGAGISKKETPGGGGRPKPEELSEAKKPFTGVGTTVLTGYSVVGPNGHIKANKPEYEEAQSLLPKYGKEDHSIYSHRDIAYIPQPEPAKPKKEEVVTEACSSCGNDSCSGCNEDTYKSPKKKGNKKAPMFKKSDDGDFSSSVKKEGKGTPITEPMMVQKSMKVKPYLKKKIVTKKPDEVRASTMARFNKMCIIKQVDSADKPSTKEMYDSKGHAKRHQIKDPKKAIKMLKGKHRKHNYKRS